MIDRQCLEMVGWMLAWQVDEVWEESQPTLLGGAATPVSQHKKAGVGLWRLTPETSSQRKDGFLLCRLAIGPRFLSLPRARVGEPTSRTIRR